MTGKLILSTMVIIVTSAFLSRAEGKMDQSPNPDVKMLGGYYSAILTNGHYIFVNPSEFWSGTWKVGANGLRTQLRIYSQTNFWSDGTNTRPISTNLMLLIEWGSSVENLEHGYFIAPNGKFSKFQLLDANKKVVHPKQDAGTNLFERLLEGYHGNIRFTYRTHLSSLASQSNGALESTFPEVVSTNDYPCFPDGAMAGETKSFTNKPPYDLGIFKLDEVYSVSNEGYYTLLVQPVLYKLDNTNKAFLHRVDLPCVATKVHLVPKAK